MPVTAVEPILATMYLDHKRPSDTALMVFVDIKKYKDAIDRASCVYSIIYRDVEFGYMFARDLIPTPFEILVRNRTGLDAEVYRDCGEPIVAEWQTKLDAVYAAGFSQDTKYDTEWNHGAMAETATWLDGEITAGGFDGPHKPIAESICKDLQDVLAVIDASDPVKHASAFTAPRVDCMFSEWFAKVKTEFDSQPEAVVDDLLVNAWSYIMCFVEFKYDTECPVLLSHFEFTKFCVRAMAMLAVVYVTSSRGDAEIARRGFDQFKADVQDALDAMETRSVHSDIDQARIIAESKEYVDGATEFV